MGKLAAVPISTALAVAFWSTSGAAQPRPAAQGLNPDISAIGDVLADLSPRRPRITEGARFVLREVELGIQAVVDPFFRADLFLAVHGGSIDIEEAYLTALALPGGLQARVGHFHLPAGKVNLTHRPELQTIDYPWSVRRYFGDEGLASTGVALSWLGAPLGFFQELQVMAVEPFGPGDHGHAHEDGDDGDDALPDWVRVETADRRGLEQVAGLVHLRSYVDLNVAANVELGLTAAALAVERPLLPRCPPEAPCPDLVRQVLGTQRFWGANLTVRWRPPDRAIYRSLYWTTEALIHDGPEAVRAGGFTQAQWQLGRRTYLAGRFDAVQRPGSTAVHAHGADAAAHLHLDRNAGGELLLAASLYATFFPSEFSRFRLAVERTFGADAERGGDWRAALQTTFSIGPHRPHAF